MSHELQNIPFYWTALAHWLVCMVMTLQYPRRMDKWKTLLCSCGFLCLFLGYMYLTAPRHGPQFNLMMAGFALLTAAQAASLCTLNLRKTVYYASRLFLIGGFMASLSWQLYIYYAQRFPMMEKPAVQALFMLLFYGVICTVTFLLELPHRRVNPELSISWSTCLSTLVMSILIYIVSSLSFTKLDTPFGGSTYAEAFNIRSLVYFGGVAMLYALHVQICESYAVTERDAMENMLEMQYKSYQLGQESIELVNRKYHDLKHQIAVLRSEIGSDRKMEYLDQLEREILIYETQYKTGNEILDTILTSKSIHCQREGIELTCIADGSLLHFMDIVDVSVLFGNALDNAIEAVSRIPEPEQRLIDLSVSRQRGFVWIRVLNRFTGKLRMRNGMPVTTKTDARSHGYGVKSIVATAEKYGGSVTMEARDGRFELRILLPEQEQAGTEQQL